MGVKKPPYQAAEINPHWRSNTEWHVSVARWRIFFFFRGGRDQLFFLIERESNAWNHIGGVSSPNQALWIRWIVCKNPSLFFAGFVLKSFGFFFLHSISLQLVCFSCAGNLPSGCTAHCQIEMLRKKHTRCDRIVTLEFVPVSSVWTPQHSPQRPTQGIRRPGSNLFSAVHHRIDWPNLFLLLLAVRIWYAYRLKLFKQSTYISYMCWLAVFFPLFSLPPVAVQKPSIYHASYSTHDLTS